MIVLLGKTLPSKIITASDKCKQGQANSDQRESSVYYFHISTEYNKNKIRKDESLFFTDGFEVRPRGRDTDCSMHPDMQCSNISLFILLFAVDFSLFSMILLSATKVGIW